MGDANGVGPRRSGVFRRHVALVIVLAFGLATQLPGALHIHEYVLLAQDYNPIHLGELHTRHDMPAGDDSEIGENADDLVFSSALFWGPMLLNRAGVPYDVVLLVEKLLAMPLLMFGAYMLTFSLSKRAGPAAVAALAVCFADFALLRWNVGYPVLINRTLYYDDLLYFLVALQLAALVRRRSMVAAAVTALLLVANPSLGFNSAVVLGLFLLVSRAWRDGWACVARPAAVVVVGAAASVVQVRAATPVHRPAPWPARRFAIESYFHMAPHIISPSTFAIAVGTALIALGLAWRRQTPHSTGRALTASVALGVVLVTGVLYWAEFVAVPELLPATSPAKMLIVAAVLLVACAATAGANVVERLPAPAAAVCAVIFVGVGVVEAIFPPARMGLWSQRGAIAIWAGVVALLLVSPRLSIVARSPRGVAAVGVAVALAMGADIAVSAAQPFTSGQVAQAHALYEFERSARRRLPRNALLVPYRLASSSRNAYGPFRNWPIRTYSRRGGLVYWTIGRNAYFDSRQRHDAEERSYEAAGIPLWPDLLGRARAARRHDPLGYLTGITVQTRPCCTVAVHDASPWTILIDEVNKLERYVASQDLDAYRDYARRLGATHVVVSRDPGTTVPGPVVMSTRNFVVLAA